MSVDALKLEIINKIISTKDRYKLKEIDAALKDLFTEDDIIKKLNKPMRKRIDVEELKTEQNFKPINKKEFFKKVDDLNIEEPLKDLLKMI